MTRRDTAAKRPDPGTGDRHREPEAERLGLGERVLEERGRRRLRQIDAAEEIGISRRTLSRIEGGYFAGDRTRARVAAWLEESVKKPAARAGGGPRSGGAAPATAMPAPVCLPEVAIEIALAPTLERIDEDCKKVPPGIKAFLEYVREHLCEDDLKVVKARRAVELRDNSFSTHFRRCLGRTAFHYIDRRRMEVADRLLRNFGFAPGEAGAAVGILEPGTFSRRYQAWCGDRPSEAQGKKMPAEADYAIWRRALRGELDPGTAFHLETMLRRLYRGAGAPRVAGVPAGAAFDGPAHERSRAEALWEDIRELPFEVQRLRVTWDLFRTTALFDLLREKSRQEGRKDRRLGVRLAELALASLEGCGEWWTERIHDLRALALAWLGNARRLALDFPGAAEDFRLAYAEWNAPRSSPDERVLAEIYYLHSGLRFQRRFDEAIALEDKAVTIFRSVDAPDRLAEVLIARAATFVHSGDLKRGIADLHAARDLPYEDNGFLTLCVSTSLAASYGIAGRLEKAEPLLRDAKKLCNPSEHPQISQHIEWIEGIIAKARGRLDLADRHFTKASRGFVEFGDTLHAAIVVLDSALLSAEQGNTRHVIRLISGAMPTFGALNTHRETAAALKILQESLEARNLSVAVLQELRGRLEKARLDPLIRFKIAESEK